MNLYDKTRKEKLEVEGEEKRRENKPLFSIEGMEKERETKLKALVCFVE